MDEETIGTLLDVVAVLAVAFGAAAALFPLIGWAAVGVAGVIVFLAVRAHDMVQRRARR